MHLKDHCLIKSLHCSAQSSEFTYISGFQLNFVINTGYSDLTLAAHGEVVGVGCDE